MELIHDVICADLVERFEDAEVTAHISFFWTQLGGELTERICDHLLRVAGVGVSPASGEFPSLAIIVLVMMDDIDVDLVAIAHL
jgi:hypothetical protein